MTIFTHFAVDLDAAASVWAAKTFIPGMVDAPVRFVSANWNGNGLAKGDLAVDISAGGKGIKGKEDADGTVHSSFASLITTYASDQDQTALAHLIAFIDAQDSRDNAAKWFLQKCEADEPLSKAEAVWSTTGLNAVLRALQAIDPHNDAVVVQKFGEILTGLLQIGRARQRAIIEAKRAQILNGGRVAICQDNQEFATNGILFEQGVRAIVYVDGPNLGVIREGSVTIRMDHPIIRAVVKKAGEKVGDGDDQWFAHPAGFLFCRGSRKAPAETPSRVNPRALAEALDQALSGYYSRF